MKMRMEQVPRALLLQRQQRLHTALWSSYLHGQGTGKGQNVPREAMSVTAALRTLDHARGTTAPAVLGLALWNLLDADLAPAQSKLLDELLFNTLGLTLAQARGQKVERDGEIFPPFSEPTVMDVDWQPPYDNAGTTKATLGVV